MSCCGKNSMRHFPANTYSSRWPLLIYQAVIHAILACVGAARTLTCMALGEGALLVQISQRLFLDFIAAKPRTLQIYLQKAMARLWRVAHFVLTDFLDMALPASAASGHAVGRGLPPHQQYQQQRSPHSQDYSAQPGGMDTQNAHLSKSLLTALPGRCARLSC